MTAARVLSVLFVALAVAGAATTQAAAQDRAPVRQSEAWDLERAFIELERLRTEIVTLRGLAGAQAALLAWNSEKAESGAGPAVLAVHLCADPPALGLAWQGPLPGLLDRVGGLSGYDWSWETLVPETLVPETGRRARAVHPLSGRPRPARRALRPSPSRRWHAVRKLTVRRRGWARSCAWRAISRHWWRRTAGADRGSRRQHRERRSR